MDKDTGMIPIDSFPEHVDSSVFYLDQPNSASYSSKIPQSTPVSISKTFPKTDNDQIETYGFEMNMVLVNVVLLSFIGYLLILLTDALGLCKAVSKILCFPFCIIAKVFEKTDDVESK